MHKAWKNLIFFVTAGAALAVLGGMVTHARARAAAVPPQAGYTVQSAPGGTIQGKLLWVGKPVKPRKLSVTQDRSACGNMKEIYPVHVEQGGVAGAVVWLDDASHGKAFAFAKPVVDQKKCMFTPHVVLMKPGKVELLNSDPVRPYMVPLAMSSRSSKFRPLMTASTGPKISSWAIRALRSILPRDVHGCVRRDRGSVRVSFPQRGRQRHCC